MPAGQHQKQPKFLFKYQDYSVKNAGSWMHIEEDSNLMEISHLHPLNQSLARIFHLETLSNL